MCASNISSDIHIHFWNNATSTYFPATTTITNTLKNTKSKWKNQSLWHTPKYKLILRLARSLWQTNHSPDSRRKVNQASNNLKLALYKLRNAAFTNYITNLHRDYSIWRPIRSNKKHTTPNPLIRKNSTSPGCWAISDKEKADLFASYLPDVFSPYDRGTAPDIEQNWTNLSIQQTHQSSRRTN